MRAKSRWTAARDRAITDAGETTSRADFEIARRAGLQADALPHTIVVRAVKNEGGRNTAEEYASSIRTRTRPEAQPISCNTHQPNVREGVRPYRPWEIVVVSTASSRPDPGGGLRGRSGTCSTSA